MRDLRDYVVDFEAGAQRVLARRIPAPIRLPNGDRHLGPLLRRLRQDAGLTQEQLGQRVNVTNRAVCARELHPNAMTAGALIETLDALGYDVVAVHRDSAIARRAAA